MEHESLFLKQWLDWKKKHAFVRFEVELAMPPSNQEDKAYFVIKGQNVPDYQFILGVQRENGELDGDFTGDFSERCDTYKYCYWIQQMQDFVFKNAENGLVYVLNEAVRLYKIIINSKDERYNVTKIHTKGFKSTLQNILEMTYNTPKGLKIMPRTLNVWDIVVDGRYNRIKAEITIISSSGGIYGELRVISPRIDPGRNVNFGGSVSYKGLAPGSHVYTTQELIKSIHHSLHNEIADPKYTIPYSDDEYMASISETKATANTQYPNPMNVLVDTRGLFKDIQSDTVAISSYLSGKYLKFGEPFLYTRIMSDSGLTTWARAIPGEGLDDTTIVLSSSIKTNINYFKNEKVKIAFGNLHLPDKLIIRPRGNIEYDNDNEILIDHFDKLTVITSGKTYAIKMPNNLNVYVDVFYAGPSGACTLHVSEKIDIDILFNVLESLEYQQEVLTRRSPLAIYYDTEESEESSD